MSRRKRDEHKGEAKMKLFVVRHGETEWNAMKKLQGSHDIPLNETGKRQAKEAKLALEAYDYDVVFSSPYKRAAMTARIINEVGGKPIFYDDRLKERNFGKLEGKLRGTYDYTRLWDYEKEEPLGGESVRVFLERVFSFLDDLKRLSAYRNVLIVCHGGTMRAIDCYFNGIKTAKDMAAFFSKNAEVRIYEL